MASLNLAMAKYTMEIGKRYILGLLFLLGELVVKHLPAHHCVCGTNPAQLHMSYALDPLSPPISTHFLKSSGPPWQLWAASPPLLQKTQVLSRTASFTTKFPLK